MSHLKNYSYEKQGVWNRDNYHYVQAVRVGDTIHLAGQGGWDADTGVIHKEIGKQIDQAFANVELALRDAGGKGWDQVFRINTYHTDLSDEVQEHMVRNFRKYMPIVHATWTCVEIRRLGGGPDMNVEIEVQAHDPEGATKAAAEKP